ncbi:hypothetical protein [Uliginosibacterium gangwonense]|uniref:hypothetical protein n=1 Tax=Uliginosibacterium gangwonense TaxID=392736 RepID=UPI0012F97A15|nr:hypothetical protein [Uliginosibacterium gangwonense]
MADILSLDSAFKSMFSTGFVLERIDLEVEWRPHVYPIGGTWQVSGGEAGAGPGSGAITIA